MKTTRAMLVRLLLKLRSRLKMLSAPLQQKNALVCEIILALFLGASLHGNALAQAQVIPCPTALPTPDVYELGTGVNSSGFCTSLYTGATAATVADLDATQNKSLLKQLDQYAKQIEEVQQLTIQTETLLRDLEENPLQVIVPDANQLIANQRRIDKLAQDIAKNSSTTGDNLIKDLQHPDTIGLGYGSKFQLWNDARQTSVEESYSKVSNFLKEASDRNKTITEAIYNINHAQGRTATAKAAAQATGQELELMHRLLETLNQLVGMQAVENGAKLQAEVDATARAAAMNRDMIVNPPFGGSSVMLPPDNYQGPGDPAVNKGF